MHNAGYSQCQGHEVCRRAINEGKQDRNEDTMITVLFGSPFDVTVADGVLVNSNTTEVETKAVVSTALASLGRSDQRLETEGVTCVKCIACRQP